jgi:hypothetical protein
MISSEEFQQQLQSGRIQEALALVSRDPTLLQRGFTHALDITTHSTPDTAPERAVTNGYLRTKIDLLTGKIHNEVSQNLVLDRASYLNLQQLHITQIVASYRIVQGHLERVKAILTALSPTTTAQSQAANIAGQEQPESGGMGELTATLLQTRLTHSLSMLTANSHNHDDIAEPTVEQIFQEDVAASAERTPAESIDSIAPVRIVDPGEFDEIDLSVCENDEIWEEWVEDDDFPPESVMPQPTPVPGELKLPDLQEHWVRRPLSPIDVKPIVPRATPIAIDPAERWEKFVPEYIEIDPDRTDRSQPNRTLDPSGMDRLLANLVGKTADLDRHAASQPPEHDN